MSARSPRGSKRRRKKSTVQITPDNWCGTYLCTLACWFIIPLLCIGIAISESKHSCYIELFVDSVSVSNQNVSSAFWNVGFVANSPVSNCKLSLTTIKSRLLRGDQVISKSSSPLVDSFGQVVTGDKIHVVFETVEMPRVIGDVIWDIRVEIVAGMKTDTEFGNGFLLGFCGDIPVKFTVDQAGYVVGSLLGNMRRCDYLFRDKLDLSVYRS